MEFDLTLLISIWNVIQAHGWDAGIVFGVVLLAKTYKGKFRFTEWIPDWALLPFGGLVSIVVVLAQGTPLAEIAEPASSAWLIAVFGKTVFKQIQEARGKT